MLTFPALWSLVSQERPTGGPASRTPTALHSGFTYRDTMSERMDGNDTHIQRIQALAEFRFALRKFLHFSEDAALRVGLTPQHHQLLLQIAGAPPGTIATLGYLAGRLALRHHSVVELAKRCEEAGLLVRGRNPDNRRHVVLQLSCRGETLLRELSADHSCELNELGPQMIKLLMTLGDSSADSSSANRNGSHREPMEGLQVN